MAPQDVIESAPEVEKSSPDMEPKFAAISNDTNLDAEKQTISAAPALQRRLKSRHLQMIAIGMPSFIGATLEDRTYTLRWHHWNGSVHWIWGSSVEIGAGWSPHCLYLCGDSRVFSNAITGRDGNLYSCIRGLHCVCLTIC